MRILCVGVGNYTPPGYDEWRGLTTPAPVRAENGRSYRYVPPGLIYTYGGESTTCEIGMLPPSELVSPAPGVPKIQGWGILEINDTYSRVLKVPVEEQGIEQPHEHETKVIPARDRANHIHAFWNGGYPSHRYGALIIKGEMPTEGELFKAREIREASAREHLNAVINDQRLARQGHAADKRGFSPVDRFWAYEYGVILPETVDSMQKTQVDEGRIACPNCAEDIKSKAYVCIHCDTKFKFRNKPITVEEYINNQVEEEVEA